MLYTTFSSHCIYASPGQSTLARTHIHAVEPWSGGGLEWMYSANVCPSVMVLGGCFPGECDADALPLDGSLRYHEIAKCEVLRFDAGSRVSSIGDADGNRYILTSTTTSGAAVLGEPAVLSTLPAGWTRATETLRANLTVSPTPTSSTTGRVQDGARAAFASFACGHAVVRDGHGSVYTRYHTTTGNANLLDSIHLAYEGNTPQELQSDKLSYIIVIATSVLLLCFCGVFCGIRHCAQNEMWCFGKGVDGPPSRSPQPSEATPLASARQPLAPGEVKAQ